VCIHGVCMKMHVDMDKMTIDSLGMCVCTHSVCMLVPGLLRIKQAHTYMYFINICSNVCMDVRK
jgi:hypothetical protein